MAEVTRIWYTKVDVNYICPVGISDNSRMSYSDNSGVPLGQSEDELRDLMAFLGGLK